VDGEAEEQPNSQNKIMRSMRGSFPRGLPHSNAAREGVGFCLRGMLPESGVGEGLPIRRHLEIFAPFLGFSAAWFVGERYLDEEFFVMAVAPVLFVFAALRVSLIHDDFLELL
jgi:hypothetical protein